VSTFFRQKVAEKEAAAGKRPAEGGPQLADWALRFRQRLQRGGASVFIVHGPGVRDIHPSFARRWVNIRDFLAETMFGDRTVIKYDRSAGIRFGDKDTEEHFKSVLRAYDKASGSNLAGSVPRDPDRALQLIDSYIRNQLQDNPRFQVAVLIDYADTLAPAGDAVQLPVEDRATVVTLRRWAAEPLFLRKPFTCCVIAEAASQLNASLVGDPRTHQIEVPVPTEDERYAFLTDRGGTPDTWSRIEPRTAAVLTGGLTRLNLESLMAEAEQHGAALDADALTREKKRLIEEASGGLLEFVSSRVGLDAVAGHEAAKALLRETASALRAGRLDVIPMGFLICGPVGTGKSFIVQCFAAEIGVPVVAMKNFRSKWQGQTEANLERILAIIDSIGPTAVVVDEADAALGSRDDEGGDSGTSERVFAKLAAFMGDTRRRGRVLWFLMTSRPDLVPIDLKRQGRAEEHIALFPPQTPEERAVVFERLRTRLKVPVAPDLDVVGQFARVPHAMSAADIEGLLVRASRRLAAAGEPAVSNALLHQLVEDFQPPAYPLEIEYQTLIAAMECTSKQLLPADLAAATTQELSQRLAGIRAALGR
jgi:AAA+ superfamily predicted ATPase